MCQQLRFEDKVKVSGIIRSDFTIHCFAKTLSFMSYIHANRAFYYTIRDGSATRYTVWIHLLHLYFYIVAHQYTDCGEKHKKHICEYYTGGTGVLLVTISVPSETFFFFLLISKVSSISASRTRAVTSSHYNVNVNNTWSHFRGTHHRPHPVAPHKLAPSH